MDYQIELRHFHYFKVLAEELHFRKAAEKLFISQPGLTRQIKQMEDIYGILLLERGKRHVRLTQAGEFLKKEVDLILQQVKQTQGQLQKMAEGKMTELKIGFIGTTVQIILPQLLVTLKQEHPLIDISLEELSNENQLRKIQNNEIDFGFVRMESVPPDIHLKTIYTEHFSLVVPKNLMPKGRQKSILQLYKDHPFILFAKEYSGSYYELVMGIFRDAGFMPHIALRTVNALSIFQMVEQGLGVAIVPSSLKIGYDTDVNFIELKDIPQRTRLSIIWNSNNRNPGIPIVLDMLKNDIIHKP